MLISNFNGSIIIRRLTLRIPHFPSWPLLVFFLLTYCKATYNRQTTVSPTTLVIKLLAIYLLLIFKSKRQISFWKKAVPTSVLKTLCVAHFINAHCFHHFVCVGKYPKVYVLYECCFQPNTSTSTIENNMLAEIAMSARVIAHSRANSSAKCFSNFPSQK